MKNHANDAALLLKALAHPVRLMVLCRLVEREYAVSEMVNGCDLSSSALSQHLAILRSKRLVRTRRESQHIYYSIERGRALAIIQALYASYCGKARKSRAQADR